MAYAVVGIPLCLVLFNSIGERVNNFSSVVINKLRKTLKAKEPETTETDLIIAITTLSLLIGGAGAVVFSHYEREYWTHMRSYFGAES